MPFASGGGWSTSDDSDTGWKIYGPEGAAALRGLKPTTVASRMQRLGLKRPASP